MSRIMARIVSGVKLTVPLKPVFSSEEEIGRVGKWHREYGRLRMDQAKRL